jgi:DNA-binding transcriptional regulator LsrR (DeoR family)
MQQNEKRRLMIKTAKLYYYGHMTQEEISQMLDISRPKVARLLAEAERLGIVQVTVNDPYFNREEAAELLRSHLGLKQVVIVPSGSGLKDAKDNIGRAGSELLNRQLTDTIKIGISWGTTVNAFVSQFQPLRQLPRARVVQLVGGMYSQSMHMDGREMARALANKLHCQFSALQTPMFVHNPDLRELIMREPETQEHFRFYDELDMAFVGIGSSNYKDSVIYKANYIEEKEAREIYSLGLCDICGHQIDQNGVEPVESLKNRLIGISLEDLRRVPMVVGMCAGKDRTMSILSGVRGGYLKALVVDEIAAITLIEEEKLGE